MMENDFVAASRYLFQSQRLGFRNWLPEDLDPMTAINNNPAVMEFFPSVASKADTAAFTERMQRQFTEKGYCYFAVELLTTSAFIGFIGMSDQTYDAYFTPCVDIGWRLDQNYWNQGFATEGARRCLQFAFDTFKLKQIYAVAPSINLKSIGVMKKIGMQQLQTFQHPKLADCPRLSNCVVYYLRSEDELNLSPARV